MIVLGVVYLVVRYRRGGARSPRRPASRPPMRRAEVVALGLVQGPAELLPISSSGHVAALPLAARLGARRAGGARRKEVEVALHAGAAVALLVGLRRELRARRSRRRARAAARRWRSARWPSARSRAAGRRRARSRPACWRAPRRWCRPTARRRARARGGRRAARRARARARPGLRAGAGRLALRATLAAARARGFARPDAVRLSRASACRCSPGRRR